MSMLLSEMTFLLGSLSDNQDLLQTSPDTMSNVTDQCSPSFLNLPAEMRNIIYTLLFAREGPILLRDAIVWWSPKPKRSNHAHRPIYHDASDLILSVDFLCNFDDALSLLRTCRQIHEEAAGILYGHNTFIVSRFSLEHDNDYRFGSGHLPVLYAPR